MPLDETFDYIKARYEKRAKSFDKTTAGPGHSKVLARDEKWFITELPGKWRLDYERRKEHVNSGYFCPNNVPYKTFANLRVIDAYDLLGEGLCMNVSKRYTYNAMQGYYRANRPHSGPAATPEDLINTIVVCDVTKRKKKLPPSTTAGLDFISRELGARKRTLRDVRAGSSLLDSLTRESQRQDVLQLLKAPKVIFQKGQPVTINKACTYLPPMLPTASSKICLLMTPPKSLINPGGEGEDEVAGRIKKMNRPSDGKDEEENNLKNLLRKNFFAKVKSIYAILCCLHNIKSRDLRRYKPFSFATIKTLSKRPLHLASKDQQYHLYTASLLAHHHLNLLQSNYYANILADKKAPRMSLSLWEDILYLHEDHLWFNSSSANTDNLPQGPIKMQARTLPAWKRKVVFVEGDKFRKPDPAESLSKRIKAFHYFKSEMSQKVDAALQEKEQLQQRTLALNMEHFVCGPIIDKSLQEMRGKTYQIRWAERKKDLEKPEWFVLLEEEVTTVFGDDGLEEQGLSALECLKQFMYICMENIPLVIEKLCLIAMSLPAHYLCIEQVIVAFQFVSEFFLKTSPKLIEQLRQIRQLPPVFELHPPDFLFGMHIHKKTGQ